jgi:2-keto-3-deoxy-L-rhamnonate aldolase RhmA
VQQVQTIQTVSEGSMFSVVRIPTVEGPYIARALDAGASGIILPHSETPEQVKKLVGAARFG